jgi:hypothetical protein
MDCFIILLRHSTFHSSTWMLPSVSR